MQTQTLNAEALTPARQALLTDALGNFSLTMENGKFSPMSADSLKVIGLSPIEIDALEKVNAQLGGSVFVVGDYKETNPFLKETWNPDKQRQILESDKEKGIAFMKAAGIIKQ